MKIRLENILEIVFCIAGIPIMLAFLPLGQWLSYDTVAVTLFILWVYGVYFLNTRINAKLLTSDGRRKTSAAAIMVLMTAVTALMTLYDVSIPIPDEAAESSMQPHQRLVWILYWAVFLFSIGTGLLSEKLRSLRDRVARMEKEEVLHDIITERGVQNMAGEKITVTSDYRSIAIPVMEIRYIESRNNYACIHLDHQEDIVTQTTLKSLLEKLPEGKFIRIHRSYIIPVYRIEHRSAAEVKLFGEDKPLPVGRAYKDVFTQL